MDRNGPSSTDRNGPSSMDRNGPSSMDRNGPSSMDRNGPSSTDRNGPSSMDRNGPSSTDRNGPSSMDRNGPSSIDRRDILKKKKKTINYLASVELDSWAARGSRRGSALPPFCTSLVPTEASSRTEILQAVSSAIIHLFQRKPLKENQLGLLQEHVRFLIGSEAGGLVHEYYKDQLLRKGMIILREKIKNEQGLELLKQLNETWQYFFKEILPALQAILYPLAGLLGKDETVRSLSLLAFRNIVVLKVSLKEALDCVEKHLYPSNIQQMLLVLQSIQDNVFLSENQFILEKLVARVVCPYLGQRGIYEGSPNPVIRVKLKPIPIPLLVLPDSQQPEHRLDYQKSSLSVSPWRGIHDNNNSVTKLKPVLEHVYDGGRRHSIIS
ncbi:unnamed protein product [Candidula unifasciata]|uniref:Proline-rich protein 5 n=1 Tax=Candidula unifasciata TaxID=100452 RepID=A0A8S3YTM1_9EUPU|nr:unnamed protein product [Candidula unifasciata]